ncbi:MAG: UDP-N-acetylmuramoyl-L-alanine--D-glutamate ligase [Patescibacteria group bacterium]|jgi:UDP-N-acetylmuramoylalanine--D-glutamate ligase|nr:UDP-N-acetylmuramoyl-L-alanine--D-glutamate ligase [Patescibacteria group bacterium]
MKISELKNKKVTVMGIGLHGGSVQLIKWLLEKGAIVTATDIKNKESLKSSIEKIGEHKNLKVIAGQHRPEDFQKAELVIKNPTVPWKNKYIQMALKGNIPIEMDASLFFQFCKSKNIIGITGTKGKTTTSSLIAEILKKAGKKVVNVGIGQEPVMSKLSQIEENTFVVFELSSWRLSGVDKLKISPKIAIVTNIYPDHLNHYLSMENYIEDKKAIFRHQEEGDNLILNWDNKITREFADEAIAQKVFFSMNKIDLPVSVFINEGKIIYRNDEGEEKVIVDIKKIRLRGAHNISNALTAITTGIVLGIDIAVIKSVIEQFPGVKHRLEYVGKIKEKFFYNDTTATTPDSAIAGVNSFWKPITLICGGSDKKLDLGEFAKKIASSKSVKKIILLKGEATEKLKKMIEENGGKEKIIDIFENIEEAVQKSDEVSEEGEVILLSPGCASFGMFENEFDRGRKFKEAVGKLSA